MTRRLNPYRMHDRDLSMLMIISLLVGGGQALWLLVSKPMVLAILNGSLLAACAGLGLRAWIELRKRRSERAGAGRENG